jgi:hypothetical protein
MTTLRSLFRRMLDDAAPSAAEAQDDFARITQRVRTGRKVAWVLVPSMAVVALAAVLLWPTRALVPPGNTTEFQLKLSGEPTDRAIFVSITTRSGG